MSRYFSYNFVCVLISEEHTMVRASRVCDMLDIPTWNTLKNCYWKVTYIQKSTKTIPVESGEFLRLTLPQFQKSAICPLWLLIIPIPKVDYNLTFIFVDSSSLFLNGWGYILSLFFMFVKFIHVFQVVVVCSLLAL